MFTGGINIGPYEAAKHIAGVTARELSMVRNRHITLKKLNAAIADAVNAFAELDVVKAWGGWQHGGRRRHAGGHLHR
ncbi:Tn3 family transposase [Streptosporangium canum]